MPVKKTRTQPQKVEDRTIKIDAFSEAIAGFETKSIFQIFDVSHEL